MFKKPRGNADEATQFLHVSGLGEKFGCTKEQAIDMISSVLRKRVPPVLASFTEVYLVEGASYIIVELESIERADEVRCALDGEIIISGIHSEAPTKKIRVAFATRIDKPSQRQPDLLECTSSISDGFRPPGLELISEFVTETEEAEIIAELAGASWDTTLGICSLP